MRHLAFAACAVMFIAGVHRASGATDPFTVRATAKVQQLGGFNVTADPTFEGAISAFGDPDACTMRSWYALAVWRTLGFRLRITTLGALANGATFCSDPAHVQIDAAIVTGRRWHTPRGLFIGDSIAKLHRLYPRARRFRNGWGIAAVYQRCVIGACARPYEWAPRLTASFVNGHVASFIFPVGAQGE